MMGVLQGKAPKGMGVGNEKGRVEGGNVAGVGMPQWGDTPGACPAPACSSERARSLSCERREQLRSSCCSAKAVVGAPMAGGGRA